MSKNFIDFLREIFIGATITSIILLALHIKDIKDQVKVLTSERVEVEDIRESLDYLTISLKTTQLQLDAKNKCDYHAKVITAKTQSACIDAMIVLGDFSKEYLK